MIRVQVWDADYVNPQGVKTGGWEEVYNRFNNDIPHKEISWIVDDLANNYRGHVYRAISGNEVIVLPRVYATMNKTLKEWIVLS